MTGQAHPTQRRLKQLRFELSRTRDDAAVGDSQRQLLHVLADAPVTMMVLAVHVGRHHPAERHESRAGRDRGEPAARQEHPVQLIERESSLGVQQPGGPIEGEGPIGERRRRNHRITPRRQRRISVGAAKPARQRHLFGNGDQIFRADFTSVDARNASPTG